MSVVEKVNITKEPTIEDLESDTKHIMDKQIKELTSEIEGISEIINNKLEQLRLGVLQKTINKVIQKAFDERLDKITNGMKTGFSLELRKVILEKYFATELGNLKEKITEDINNSDYQDADVRWAKVREDLTQIQDLAVKMKWRIFENEYLLKRSAFRADQKDIKTFLNEYKEKIEINVKNEDYPSAQTNWVEGKVLLERTKDKQLKEKWQQFEETYLRNFRNFMQLNLQKMLEYESKYEENYAKDYLNASLNYSDKIIEIAEKIGNQEKIDKYIKRRDQIEKRIAYQKQFTEQETQDLLQKAQSIGQFMHFDDGVLPLVDYFAIGDLIENKDTLLKEHRVKIKNELDTNILLKSESGEIYEEHISKGIQRSEDDNQIDVLYSVETGIVNPFDESIEEALLKDLIPYNFEIMNVHVNGKLIENLPEKQLSKDGMVLAWEFGDIPTKEKVQVVYDLRRRVSRTILFYLKNELRVIKTHSKLSSTEIEGVYQATIPFTNNFDDTIQEVIVEDIIPLYYVYFIKQPMDLQPTEINSSRNGDMIKWDVGTMEIGTRDYQYKLFELYKYEELKIKMTNLSSSLMECLHNQELNKVAKKNSEIDDALKLLSN